MRVSPVRSLASWMFATALAIVPILARGENWPQFRGPNGVGVSLEKGFVTNWSADRIAWTVELPGEGHSAPVIWGDKLFLTAAENGGTAREVLCLDPATGKRLWTKTLDFHGSRKHAKNSWASSTPAVDGERVYAVFADIERQVLYAFDFAGNKVWEKTVGGFESQHGQGASPIVYEDLVILVNDQDGPSSINAYDRRTGREVWTAPRKSGSQSTSYATPMIYRPKEGPPQLICSSSKSGVSGLDPHTGQTIWSTQSLPARTVSSPILSNGLIIQACGGGGQGLALVAVDPNGQGDVEKSHVRYTRKKILPYVPTPVACGKYVFLWGDHGIVSCMDPQTGKDVWTHRVGGEYSGSPICASGMLFNTDEHGNVVVLEAGDHFKSLGTIPLGDPSHSTPAVANGRIYFRTFHHLACVQARP